MADDEAVDRSEWLVAPPAAGEVRLTVELGEGAQLSAEATEALERLVSEIEDAEVTGFMMSGLSIGLFGGITLNSSCGKMDCAKHNCSGVFECSAYNSQFTQFR